MQKKRHAEEKWRSVLMSSPFIKYEAVTRHRAIGFMLLSEHGNLSLNLSSLKNGLQLTVMCVCVLCVV